MSAENNTVWSQVFTGTFTVCRMPFPPNLRVTQIADKSVTLAWNEQHVDGYELICRNLDNDGDAGFSMQFGEHTTGHTVNNLQPGTRYMFSLTAIHDGNEEGESVEVCTKGVLDEIEVNADPVDPHTLYIYWTRRGAGGGQ
jgi:hypothetical protein